MSGGTTGVERTTTGPCPVCHEVKGVTKKGKMASHSIGQPGHRTKCPGVGKTPMERHVLKTTDPVFGVYLGEQAMRTHPADKCAGEFCCIHNPSDHHMVGWSMLYRADTRVMERTCPHGVGHPDPDDLTFHARRGQTWQAVHGCDGCCSPDPEKRRP